jgi:hypothetical protein
VLATVVWFGGLFLADRMGVPGAVAVAVAVGRLAPRSGYHPVVLVIYLVLLVSGTTIAVEGFWNPVEDAAVAAYLIAFLAILPIFNALADFFSVGLTRYLLRKGLEGTTWLRAALDLFGGALIFALLGCSLITYFHLVRTPDGPLLDIAGLFQSLKTNPADHWWLFFMLFSTLIPTALHAMIGLLTILIQYPAWVRRPVVAWLTAGETSDTAGWKGSMAVCAMITLSIWVPVLLIYLVLTANHGWVLSRTIAGFEAYARLIGAI